MSTWYQITIKGHMDRDWLNWLEPQSISYDESDNTIFTVEVPDQPALHGILERIRDLNLPLISVTPFDPSSENFNERRKI